MITCSEKRKHGVVAWMLALAVAATLAGDARAIIKRVDRAFPEFWCPIDTRPLVPGGTDLTFIAPPGGTVRLTFSARNWRIPGNPNTWSELMLDDITVVRKDTFDASDSPSFECYSECPDPPFCDGFDGTPGAPIYNDTVSNTEVLRNTFDENAQGWTGAHLYWDSDWTALRLGRQEDGDVTVSATKIVTGLSPGVLYQVYAMWFTLGLPSVDVAIGTCFDLDDDGYVVCDGCELEPGQACGDCDEASAAVHAGAVDATCNGIDNDCDGPIDEDFPSTCQCSELGAGIVAWWPANSTPDDIRGNHDGSLQNGATYGPGRAGQAFSLDGINDYVRVAHNPALDPGTGSFTVAAWVRTSAGTSQMVLSKYECGGFCPSNIATPMILLYLSSMGRPQFDIRDDENTPGQSISGPSSVADGAWHHLAGRRDMATNVMDLRVDGVLVASSPLTTSADGPIADSDGEPDPLTIGANVIGGSSALDMFFSGQIDEAMYFGRALAPGEIQALHASGSTGMCHCIDADEDGYGADGLVSCPAGTLQDCDETRAVTHPGAADAFCNGVDDDCDGPIDEASPTPCQCPELGDGAVSWWPANSTSDDIRGNHDGSLLNGATYGSGRAGQAFSVDGTDDYVAMNGPLSSYSFIQNTGVFTIAAWINLTNASALLQQAITADTATTVERGHFFIWDNTTGQKRLRIGLMKGIINVPVIDSSVVASAITTGTWHHVAAVGDGAHVTFYVDGVAAAGSGTMGSFSVGGSSRPLDLGRCPHASPLCQFGGRIDELQIFDRALGAAEVQAIYDAGSTGMCHCIDADLDGYGVDGGVSCPFGTHQDCDDDDPAINPAGIPGMPAPTGSPNLLVTIDEIFVGPDPLLVWAASPGATHYDVVAGNLTTLRSSGGNFTTAVSRCVADHLTSTSVTDPAAGTGFFYLVRPVNCGGNGTYDSGAPSQVGARDAEIGASANACP